MRLDKFLKISRLVKRRTVANTICDSAKVFVNNNPAKPSKQLKIGDIISIEYKTETKSYKVTKLPEGNVSIAQASETYEEIIDCQQA